MLTIPLASTPSQTMTCILSGLNCSLWLRQLSTGLYLDIKLNGQPFIMGALCLNGVDIIRNPASPLPGKLYFTDTQGSADPDYTGLGTRFLLQYEGGTT